MLLYRRLGLKLYLYVLSAYAPQERRGPVIWLRCIVERTLPEVSPPEGVVPILYLPKVSRQDLRPAQTHRLWPRFARDFAKPAMSRGKTWRSGRPTASRPQRRCYGPMPMDNGDR